MQMYISDKELPWDVSFHFSQWKETYLWKPGSSSRLHLTRKLRHTLLHSTPNHVSAHDVYFCQLSSFVFLAFFSSVGLKPHKTKDKNKKIGKSFIKVDNLINLNIMNTHHGAENSVEPWDWGGGLCPMANIVWDGTARGTW